MVRLLILILTIGVALISFEVEDHRPASIDAKSEADIAARVDDDEPRLLRLTTDGKRVLGWITGSAENLPRQFEVTDGDDIDRGPIRGDGTFEWTPKVAGESRTVTFRVLHDDEVLRRTVWFSPRPDSLAPTAFFVVDRTVYRPGQEVQFAVFLRRAVGGRFVPDDPDRPVEVTVRSKSRDRVVARLGLDIASRGRRLGRYRFAKDDVLDDYVFAVEGYTGSAEVRLAEFRKAKVKLAVQGRMRDDEDVFDVTFSALDFVDRPVAAERVDYQISVVRQTTPATVAPKSDVRLDPTQFIYRTHRARSALAGLDATGLVLLRAGEFPGYPKAAETVLSMDEGAVAVGEGGVARLPLALPREWRDGLLSVRIAATMIDGNGREQCASTTIPIKREKQRKSLIVTSSKSVVGSREEIVLTLEPNDDIASAAVVALRLERKWDDGFMIARSMTAAWNHTPSAMGLNGNSRNRYRYRRPTNDFTVKEEVTTATAFLGDRATLRLNEPGAYRLVVVARTTSGDEVRSETTCVVRRAPVRRVHLALDADLVDAGTTVSGTVRFAGADPNTTSNEMKLRGHRRGLLVLRDASGIRVRQVIDIDLDSSSSTRFRLPVPVDASYGATLDFECVAGAGDVLVDGVSFRVQPVGRLLDVDVTVKDKAAPGEEIEVVVDVGRKDSVDLVVSVHDRSLLGVVPDRGARPESFWWADLRAHDRLAWELIERQIGDVSVGEAAQRLEDSVRVDGSLNAPAYQIVRSSSLVKGAWLSTHQIMILLRAVGVPARTAASADFGSWGVTITSPEDRLIEALRDEHSGWRLAAMMVDDVFVFEPFHPEYIATPQRDVGGLGSSITRNFARADARHSWMDSSQFSVGANAMYSPSAQSFVSHGIGSLGMSELDVTSSTSSIVRHDFSDLAFFSGDLRTDANGRATVRFRLPDSLTNWRVVVTAIGDRGAVGRAEASVRTDRPVMIWPMLPRMFTMGDRIDVYALVHNRTDVAQPMNVAIEVTGGRVLSPRSQTVTLEAGESTKVYWTFEPTTPGFTEILMQVTAPSGADASLKRLPVRESSVLATTCWSGAMRSEVEVDIPNDVDLDGATLRIEVAPSILDDVVATLGWLVQYPHGCVEQTMSRFLPTLKVDQVLRRTGIERPELQSKIPGYVRAGVRRLLQLQRSDGGWGWQAGGGAHEIMTSYALYGLIGAADAGYEIDDATAIDRGLDRLRYFVRHLTDRRHFSDAVYCAWVYSLRRELEPEWWAVLVEEVKSDELSDYALALALDMLVRDGTRADVAKFAARALRRRARSSSPGTAHWTTARFSRWGDDRFEITAACLEALVVHDAEDPIIDDVVRFFMTTKRGRRWNSTKDTAMIIYAFCRLLEERGVDGDDVAGTIRVRLGNSESVILEGEASPSTVFTAGLEHGRQTLCFDNAPRDSWYRAVLVHRRRGREIEASSSGLVVKRSVFERCADGTRRPLQDGDTIKVGAYVECDVHVKRADSLSSQYLLVTSPKPSGTEYVASTAARHRVESSPSALREQKASGVLCHYEQVARGGVVDRFVFHAELAGDIVLPPAQAELLYETEVRGHGQSLRLRVVDPSRSKPIGAK